jgi:hypothetical protein
MFDLHSTFTNCRGTSRRAFLRVGSLSLLGLSLPQLLAAKAKAAGKQAKDINCILLWTEAQAASSLDMKPDA